MKFRTTGAHLQAAANWAQRFTPSRPQEPVLGGVVLAVSETEVTLSGYNFDTAGSARVADVIVDQTGTEIVSARLLVAIAKTLKAKEEVTVETAQGVLVYTNSSRWELPCLPVQDYPELPKLADAKLLANVDADRFAEEVLRVIPAASAVTESPFCSAVSLSLRATGTGEHELVVATTDRYRMAVSEIPAVVQPHFPEHRLLVPSATLQAAAMAAKESGGSVTIRYTDGSCSISGPVATVTGRLIDATMPWERVDLDPDTRDASVLVNVAELRGAIDRAVVVLDKDESLTLTFHPDDGGGDVEPTAGTRARASHEFEVDISPETERTIGAKGSYLIHALDSLRSSHVLIGFGEKQWGTILFQPCDDSGEATPGFRHVVAQQRMARTST